jgi:hypothetical protein
MPPRKINPAKATPQAALALRAGTRARAAEADPAADDAGAEGEASESELAAAAKSCRAASTACADAITALDKCADELEGGTDSISTLKATEDACAVADTALDDASSKCAGLRGADAAPDSVPPPAPAPGAAAARAATVPTVAGHIEVAKLAQLGRAVLGLTGETDTAKALASITPRLKLADAALTGLAETDPVRARGVLGARLARAAQADELDGQLAATGHAADQARREKLWEGAVVDGRLKLAQAFAREDNPAGGDPYRVYSTWAKAQNTAYPELAAFEGWVGSLPKGAHKADNADPHTVLADLAESRAGAVALTKRDLARAKAAGVDPGLLSAALQQQRGSISNQEGV